MDDPAWPRRLGAASLILASASLVVVLAGPALGVQAPGGAGGVSELLSAFSAAEAMLVLFGPPALLSLAGLGLYLRLDEAQRRRARIALWAPAVIVAIPLVVLLLYVIALSTLGPG